jgi:hypothetical protein
MTNDIVERPVVSASSLNRCSIAGSTRTAMTCELLSDFVLNLYSRMDSCAADGAFASCFTTAGRVTPGRTDRYRAGHYVDGDMVAHLVSIPASGGVKRVTVGVSERIRPAPH